MYVLRSRGKRILLAFLIVLAVLCNMPALPVYANGRTVRVGVFELNGFFENDGSGTPYGYGADYLNAVAAKSGWQYEYIWAENWDECVELLRHGEVDMVAPAEQTEKRLREFDFSSYNIGMECGTLLALDTNSHLVYEDFQRLNYVRTGYVPSIIFLDSFKQYAQTNGFTPNLVPYRDTKALLAALNAGEIDAALTNLFAKTDTTKVLAKFGASPFYFMTAKEKPDLNYELDIALEKIELENSSLRTELMQTYYPFYNNTPFTKAELEYIEQAPVLTVGCHSYLKPVSYTDGPDGQVKGITRDILNEVSKISGLKFNYVPFPTGAVTYDYIREQNISLISCVEYNKINLSAKGVRLTLPYLNSQKVFVCKKGILFDPDKKLKLAISTGSQTLEQAILEIYPEFEVTVYDSMEDCFKAVNRGDADVLLQNQYVAASFLAKPHYADMITVPVEGLKDDLSLSPVLYLQDRQTLDPLLSDDRLISILNKAIRQLPEQTVKEIILRETTENQYRYTYQDFLYLYRQPLAALAVIFLALLAALWYIVHVKHKSMKLIMASEEKLRNITNNINGGVVVLKGGDELRIAYANEGFLQLLDCGKEEYEDVQNQEYATYVHPDDSKVLNTLSQSDLRSGKKCSFKLRIMRKDGSYIPTLFNGTLTENAIGEREIYCVIMDISEQEDLMKKVSFEQKKYATLFEHSEDILFEVDCRTQQLMVSPMYPKRFGRELIQSPLPGGGLSDAFQVLNIHERDRKELELSIWETLTQKKGAEGMARIMNVDGISRWCRISLYPMEDTQGNLAIYLGKILDVDDEVREKEALEQKSRIDALTGLLNKTAFFLEAREYLASENGTNAAIIFLDVDNFKQVNDKLGHMMGDYAIKETAKKLKIIFSNYDIISRFGGDEFCILLKEIPVDTLKDKLAWTVEKLRATYSEGEESVPVSVSIGAACTDGKRCSLDSLIESADKALYQAKENGKNQYILCQSIK